MPVFLKKTPPILTRASSGTSLGQKRQRIMAYLTASIKAQRMPAARDALDAQLRSLLTACKQEDRLAQQRLFKRFYDAFLTICMRYAADKDMAKELVLKAFLKIFRGLPQLTDVAAFPAWAKRITINTCLDYVRQQRPEKDVSLKDIKEPAVTASVLDQFAAADLLALVQQLPPQQRAVFSLYTLDGYSHAEIAQQLGITNDNSRYYLSSARKQLKSLIRTLER
jgi:RNA polymerase sigma factor (sigma-70 family)